MGFIAQAAQDYVKPWNVRQVWLDSASTSKRGPAITKLRQAENVVRAIEGEKPAEDGSSQTLGNPELKRARQKVTTLTRELAKIEEAEAEHAHLLRFEKLDGLQWSDISALYPPRPNVQVDNEVGTNYHAAGLHAAKVTGQRLVKDPEGPYDLEGTKYRGEPIDDDDWRVIQTIGAGWDIERIAWANLELNVLHASNQLARLSKD